MRERMQSLRAMLVSKLAEKGASKDFSFVNQQKGMFSFLCISPEQVDKLVNQHSVYLVGSSRANIAGINSHNVDALAEALVAVL
jgi:aspartate aminotransferase